MAAEFTIRRADRDDIPGLVRLLHLLFSIEADFAFDEKRQRKGLLLLLESAANCILVAASDHRVVGMCSGQLTISTAEGGVALLVEDVAVEKNWQGKGIGRALMHQIARWAAENGACRMQLLADRDNAAALNFYEKLGWGQTRLICLRKYNS